MQVVGHIVTTAVIAHRRYMSKEADFGIQLRHWLKANPGFSRAIEIKDSRGAYSIPFSEIKQEQLDYALAIKSDEGTLVRVQGMGGEPDYIYLRKFPAYIGIKYPDCFCLISPEAFIAEKKKSTRKSLTSIRARDIAVTVVESKKSPQQKSRAKLNRSRSKA